MKLKRIAAVGLAAMLAVAMPLAGAVNNALSVTASAEKTEELKVGDKFYGEDAFAYEVRDDGTLEVIGRAYSSDEENVSLTIPAMEKGRKVTSIASWAFDGCSYLSTVTIPEGIERIDGHAFAECNNLTTVTLPSSVYYIESYTFTDCERLKEFVVSEENKNFCAENGILFSKDKTKLIQYPAQNPAENYSIPSTVEFINYCAFSKCANLKKLEIPSSVHYIDAYALRGSEKLTQINVDENNVYLCSENGVLFNKDKSNLIIYPEGKTSESYTIPNSVSTIESYSFYGNKYIKNIETHNNVAHIELCAFHNCECLNKFEIPNGVTEIAEGVFSGCSSLTSIVIPDGVTKIDFLTPEYFGAFEDCTNLTSVTIPNSITVIEKNSFLNCTKLDKVNFIGTEEEWNAIDIEENGNECLTNAKIIFSPTDNPAESGPETSEPTSSGTSTPTTSEPTASKPTESTLTPGSSGNNATITEPTVFKPVLDSSTESLDEDTQTVLSGITVTDSSGAFEDGTVMNIKPAGKTENSFSFDIIFTKDGKGVQPNGKVTVKVPVPEFLKNGDIYVYHYDDDGKATLVPSKVESGFVVFEADRFSKYELTNKKLADANNSGDDHPNTGIALAAAPVILACAAVAVASKKKK